LTKSNSHRRRLSTSRREATAAQMLSKSLHEMHQRPQEQRDKNGKWTEVDILGSAEAQKRAST